MINNNCKHVALRVYDFLCNNQDNKLHTSDSSKGGTYKDVKQLKDMFDKLGVDLINIKTINIQVIEKRFKN